MPEDLDPLAQLRSNEPQPIDPTLTQLLDDALRPRFGENLDRYYEAVEQNDAEVRELQERARRCA